MTTQHFGVQIPIVTIVTRTHTHTMIFTETETRHLQGPGRVVAVKHRRHPHQVEPPVEVSSANIVPQSVMHPPSLAIGLTREHENGWGGFLGAFQKTTCADKRPKRAAFSFASKENPDGGGGENYPARPIGT